MISKAHENSGMTEFLAKHNNKEKASFHMPGHKGAAFFTHQSAHQSGTGVISRAADHDITEIPGADDLRHPDGIIKTITDRYAAIYGSDRAFISVNGSSAPIMAAIMTCVRPGHKLIASADCHISVKNGAELIGAKIVYVEPQVIAPWVKGADNWSSKDLSQKLDITAAGTSVDIEGDQSGAETLTAPGSLANKGIETSPNCDNSFCIPAGLSADSVAKALDEDPDADAVILPSPNYFGIVSDIIAIADEVHKRGKVLIVDQAHGAHLKMFADADPVVPDRGKDDDAVDAASQCDGGGMMPIPAEECGADIVIVSTHKTLASFTQTAVASIFGSRVDPAEFERKLLMLESTSPSYVLMESLAMNAEIMERHGAGLARSWRADLDWFYNDVREIPEIRVLTRDLVRRGGMDFDDSKIVVDFTRCRLSGKEAEKILIEKGIVPEFSTGSVVMFLTGIGNTRHDYELLLDALAEIAGRK